MALSISSNFEEAIEKTVHSYTNGQISIHQIADYANNSSQSFILTCGECKEQKRISVLSIDTTKTFLSNAVADFYKEHRHEHGPANYGFTTFQCLHCLPEDFVVGKALGGKPNFDHSLNEKKLNTSSAPKKTVEKVPIVTLENHRAFRDD